MFVVKPQPASNRGITMGAIISGCCLYMLAVSSAAAFGTWSDTSYYKELKESLQVQQELEPLNADLAGDAIDYYTGNVSFSITDVSIPGNFPIPVKVARTLTRGSEAFRQFADWELDVPRISGIYYRAEHMDCNTPLPPSIPSETGNINFPWQSYHRGMTLSDGNDYSGRIIPLSTVSSPPFNMPSGYQYYTKEHWLLKCVGSHFEARSPQGWIYRFDQPVPLPQHKEVCLNNDDDCISPALFALRVSSIRDRFGNRVDYHYDDNRRLTSISSTDGRLIKFFYYSNTNPNYQPHRIKRIDSHGKSWHYYYITPEYGAKLLHKVERPDGRYWRYGLYDEGCQGPCDSDPQYHAFAYRSLAVIDNYDPYDPHKTYHLTVDHPDGAQIEYTFTTIFLHRIGRNLRCDTPCDLEPKPALPRKCRMAHCRGRQVSLALIRKKITYDDNKTYSWQYSYSESEKLPDIYKMEPSDIEGGPWKLLPKTEAATRQTTTITGPESITEIVFHRLYDWREGAELSRSIKRLDDTELRRISNTWEKSPRYYGGVFGGISASSMINRNKEASAKRLKKAIIQQDGSQYSSENSDFNEYEVARMIYEYNNFSDRKRYTRRTFYHDTLHWLLNLPAATAISANGTDYFTTQEQSYYGINTNYSSLPFEEKSYGQWIKRYARYHDDGTPARIEFNAKVKRANGTDTGEYRYRELDQYKRGKPQRVTYPARYHETKTISESQTIDDSGRVTTITDLNGNVYAYHYNSLGRLIGIDAPDDDNGWLDTLIEWNYTANGNLQRIIHRCQLTATLGCSGASAYREQTTYDYLLRPILTYQRSIADNKRRYQNRQFNSHNQTVFTSYWSERSDEADGKHTEFDATQRQLKVSYDGGGVERTYYLAGNKVRQIDARGYATMTSYLAYGQPAYETALTIESPGNITTSQSVNLFDDITSIIQSGPGAEGKQALLQIEYRAYNAQHQLCKILRSDTGQTVYHRNLLGETLWLAEGVTGGSATDCLSTASEAEKLYLTHDNLGGTHRFGPSDGSINVQVTYNRDNIGNLTNLSYGIADWSYTYNSLNLVERQTLNIDGKSFVIDPNYNALGHINTLTYPSGKTVGFNPNGFGQATQVSDYVSEVRYHPTGSINTLTYGNGATYSIDLNSRRLPRDIYIQNAAGDMLSDTVYRWDQSGNVDSITDNLDSKYSIEMSYDGLNRLKTADGYWGNGSFTYDGLGNILNKSLGSQGLTYQYDNQNRLNNVSGSKIYNFSYDSRGNVTNNGHRPFSYNKLNQMIRSSGIKYSYDGHNRRVKKEVNGKTEYTVYDQAGKLLYRQKSNGDHLDYHYINHQLVTTIESR